MGKAVYIHLCLALLLGSSLAFDLFKSQKNKPTTEDTGTTATGEEPKTLPLTPPQQPLEQPANQPRQFQYSIADGIQGASQIRHETWVNGVMTGYYAYPLGDGLHWQLIKYIADNKGYRVTSSERHTEKDLLASVGQKMTTPDVANVDIDSDGEKTAYQVQKDQLGKDSATPAAANKTGFQKLPNGRPIPIPIQVEKMRRDTAAQDLKDALDKAETDNALKKEGADSEKDADSSEKETMSNNVHKKKPTTWENEN